MKSNILFLVVIVLLASCKNNKNGSDAFGTFEATETTISSESAGKIQWIKIEEGQVLNAGDTIALVDTVQLSLKREALLAQQKAASNKANYILFNFTYNCYIFRTILSFNKCLNFIYYKFYFTR